MAALASTRDRILVQLRHRPMTIAELIAAIGLTRNAILLPLSELARAGLVRRSDGAERTGRAGKPAQRYEIAPQAFEQTSPAYRLVAMQLLAVLGTPEAADRDSAMKAVGRLIHADAAAEARADGPLGLAAALAFLGRQGAEIELTSDGGDQIVLSHSCPVGHLVRVDRCICGAIAAFLSEAAGSPVASECLYADKLTCRFRVSAPGARKRRAPASARKASDETR